MNLPVVLFTCGGLCRCLAIIIIVQTLSADITYCHVFCITPAQTSDVYCRIDAPSFYKQLRIEVVNLESSITDSSDIYVTVLSCFLPLVARY